MLRRWGRPVVTVRSRTVDELLGKSGNGFRMRKDMDWDWDKLHRRVKGW